VSQGPVGSYAFSNVQANHTISASFAMNTYTIAATATAGGSIAPPGTMTYNCGDSQKYTITPNVDHHVVDVKVDGVSQGPVTTYTFTNIQANHTIDATFAIDTYTIVATAGSGGSISPPGTSTVNAGDNITYTITPNSGFNIQDVTVDGVSQGAIASYTFSNVHANHTIDATFSAIQYTLTVNTSGNGTVTKSPNQPSYNSGSTVQLTANPDPGWHLDSWSGDATGHASPLSVLMDNNKTINATFLPDIYTWNQAGTASFGISTNWTPERHTKHTDDVLKFNGGGSVTATGVTTQTIAQLLLSNNSEANFQCSAACTLTVAGGTGTDLNVP